ncbi:hypothetical protein EELLY_v1c03500 [Entomoplasma ellychniae]|uniref:RDD domain-containing protein n=1 Tax=Entomoplasma ellychniae TaxID=2114 RepID=A0A8E2QY05_9MOLU|nr:RDD family protein [Entomoplasma ellychniae]PPE04670.1 hypothetical protein EELLY_v1c03500 [Entomoplasma ellychniae]
MNSQLSKNENKVSIIDKNLLNYEYINYELASLYKVFFARLLDLLISSSIFLILSLIMKQFSHQSVLLFLFTFFISVIINFAYFVFLPYFLKGKTFGKIIFGLKIVKNKKDSKLKFSNILFREIFLLLGEWMTYYLLLLIFLVMISKGRQTNNILYTRIGIIIFFINNLLLLVWVTALLINIKFQKNHQCNYDLKHKIFIVKKITNISTSEKKFEITLKETPGFLKKENLGDIFKENESISLSVDKNKLKSEKQKTKEKNKEIDTKE